MMVRVDGAVIAFGELEALVRAPGHGAVVSFYGVVRDHGSTGATEQLQYEAYVAMAEREVARIAAEARERWGVGQLAVAHRIGWLAVGQISVGIAVGSAHRAEAFAACEFVIDQIKLRVPIWKREVGPDGAHWAGEEACNRKP